MMKITVLIENTNELCDNGLACEHGLSLYIEYEGKKILLDAGSTEAFCDNAKALNIDLSQLDACVLSHGHYDHSGGFEGVFRANQDVKVYARAEAARKYYSGKGSLHDISVPQNVLRYRDRFCFVEGQKEIFEGVYLIPHKTQELEKIGERSKLYKMLDEHLLPDDFSHEQSLVFETEKGMVIFNSCSHGGVRNIIREVKEACGGKPVYAYVGGLHMMGKKNGEITCTFTEEEVRELCDVIQKEGISYVYTGHCTGSAGLRKMQEQLGNTVCGMTTGMRFEL